MPEDTAVEAPATDVDASETDEPLRPEGVKALEEWKGRAKAAEKDARRASQLEKELSTLREQAMTDQEKAIAQARKEAAEEARAEVKGEVTKIKLQAAAVGRLADPEDANAFIDSNELEDDAAIAAAIDALIERKPHLAASATRSTGFDAGSRGRSDSTDMNTLIRRQAGRS